MEGLVLKSVLVVGAGTMGRGIAGWFACQGIRVFLADLDKEAAGRGRGAIFLSWDKLLSRGKITARQSEDYRGNLSVADIGEHPDVDLVVEAVVENRDAKVGVFRQLERGGIGGIFASNTSSIPISSMQRELDDPGRLVGLHFFNPVHAMKLVEVIEGGGSRRETCLQLKRWFDQRGKKAVLCKDSPGFIVNRVARNFYGEAFRIVGAAEDFGKHDLVMREAGGFRMGPFELMDVIGIDVNLDVTESVWKNFFYEPRFAPHPIQRKMVEGGRLGRKSGGGFYRS